MTRQLMCDKTRATILGRFVETAGEESIYRTPIKAGVRRLLLTLLWLRDSGSVGQLRPAKSNPSSHLLLQILAKSNFLIHKGLAFLRNWSATVLASRAQPALWDPAPPA